MLSMQTAQDLKRIGLDGMMTGRPGADREGKKDASTYRESCETV